MARFNELTSLFDVWRKEWLEQYHQHQFLPPRIAKRFQDFLGCPETFPGDMVSDPPIKYVTATRAEWDERTEQFTLKAYKNFFEDVDFHEDGYLYFGIRVFLEHGPTTYPKEAFWFLFRGKQNKDNTFNIWAQKSAKLFHIGADANNIEDICEHLFDLLKEDLAASPISRMGKEPYQIGFTAK